MQTVDPTRAFLRHTLATLAYRAGKVVRSVPEDFGNVRIGDTARSASLILSHIVDLLDWALSLAKGAQVWHVSTPGVWQDDVARFYASLASLDAYLASEQPLQCSPEQLFQGPIADALTHVGQIAMLRRVASSPIKGENYFKADIATGRVGPEQAAPRREF